MDYGRHPGLCAQRGGPHGLLSSLHDLLHQNKIGAAAERSESADNYRAEIWGGLLTQLILKAASKGLSTLPRPTVVVDCDNKGVVLHGNSAGRSLKEKQAQADVLRIFKQAILGQPFDVVMTWVPSHQDDQ